MIVTGIIVRNTLVMYDREHSKIGFWKTNCSELWERLHITGALSPIPSSSEGKNSSTYLSPSEPPNYVLPGTVCCSSSSNHIFFFLQLLRIWTLVVAHTVLDVNDHYCSG